VTGKQQVFGNSIQQNLNFFTMNTSIKYSLSRNHLQGGSNNYFARVEANGTIGPEEIIARCIYRGTTLTETDLRAAAMLFMEECGRAVSEGFNVNTPLVNLKPSITGTFSSMSDSFDSSRQLLRASVSMGLELAKKMQQSSPEKTRTNMAAPYTQEFEDGNSGTINTRITPGGAAIITGEELKYNPDVAAEGIFFVPVAGGAETKVAVVLNRTDTRLFFHIPTTLTPGSYKVEVRRTYTAANTVRTGEIPEILTIL